MFRELISNAQRLLPHEIRKSRTKNDPFRVIRGPKNARSQFVKARFFIENALGFVEKRLRFLG